MTESMRSVKNSDIKRQIIFQNYLKNIPDRHRYNIGNDGSDDGFFGEKSRICPVVEEKNVCYHSPIKTKRWQGS